MNAAAEFATDSFRFTINRKPPTMVRFPSVVRKNELRAHLADHDGLPLDRELRIDVGEYARDDECRGQREERFGAEPPFPDEIAGREGQHEETQIAEVEAGVEVARRPVACAHFVRMNPAASSICSCSFSSGSLSAITMMT